MLIAASSTPSDSPAAPSSKKLTEATRRARRCRRCRRRPIGPTQRVADNVFRLLEELHQIVISFGGNQPLDWLILVLATRDVANVRALCLECWYRKGGCGYETPLVNRLYEEKERPRDRSLIELMQAAAGLARDLASSWQEAARKYNPDEPARVPAQLRSAAEDLDAGVAKRLGRQAAVLQADAAKAAAVAP